MDKEHLLGFPLTSDGGYGFRMITGFARLFAPLHRRSLTGVVVALMLLVALANPHRTEAAGSLRVNAGGDCLGLRAFAGLAGTLIGCIPDGSSVNDAGQVTNAGGLAWTLVRWGDTIGWSASMYLVAEGAPAAAAPAPVAATVTPPTTVTATRVSTAVPLREPPAGGLTVGLVSGLSPRAVAASQSFDVASLSAYDAGSQRFQTYIPGSPVNTIADDPLPTNTAVFIRRRGDLPAALPAPHPAASTAGTPPALAEPVPGGTVAGLAGTGDVVSFVAAQPFPVESVSTWDTASQRWLSYLTGAPDFANSLTSGLLAADSVVFVKRTSAPAAIAPAASTPVPTASPTPVPVAAPVPTGTPSTVSYGVAEVTFYYCTPGVRYGAVGDGGGFCGYMANGERVHAGAASCASAYMGQRFLIVGDPLDRVYTCEDTGGGVTTGHRDIWFASADEGGDWWRQVGRTAEILVLTP